MRVVNGDEGLSLEENGGGRYQGYAVARMRVVDGDEGLSLEEDGGCRY